MKIDFNNQSYIPDYGHFALCTDCHLLTPCGLGLAKCSLPSIWTSQICMNWRIFTHCNTSIFKI